MQSLPFTVAFCGINYFLYMLENVPRNGIVRHHRDEGPVHGDRQNHSLCIVLVRRLRLGEGSGS